jgi:hypothetical protein
MPHRKKRPWFPLIISLWTKTETLQWALYLSLSQNERMATITKKRCTSGTLQLESILLGVKYIVRFMPTIDIIGFGNKLKKQTDELREMLDKAEKLTRIILRVAYVSLGVSVIAVNLAMVPLIK